MTAGTMSRQDCSRGQLDSRDRSGCPPSLASRLGRLTTAEPVWCPMTGHERLVRRRHPLTYPTGLRRMRLLSIDSRLRIDLTDDQTTLGDLAVVSLPDGPILARSGGCYIVLVQENKGSDRTLA